MDICGIYLLLILKMNVVDPVPGEWETIRRMLMLIMNDKFVIWLSQHQNIKDYLFVKGFKATRREKSLAHILIGGAQIYLEPRNILFEWKMTIYLLQDKIP